MAFEAQTLIANGIKMWIKELEHLDLLLPFVWLSQLHVHFGQGQVRFWIGRIQGDALFEYSGRFGLFALLGEHHSQSI